MSELWRNTKSRNSILIVTVLLTGLCASQYLGITALNLFFTFCVGCCIFLLGSLEDTVLAMFMTIPLYNLFSTSIGYKSYYYLYVVVFWYKYFKYHGWRIKRTKLLILLYFMIIRFTAGDNEAAAKWFILFSVFILTYKEECMEGQLNRIVIFMSITFIISSLFGYLMLLNGSSIYSAGHIYNNGVTTIRFAGLIGDSVFFSQICALLVGANLTLSCYYKKHLATGIVLSGIITCFCLLSYSKTGLLLILAELIIYILWALRKNAKKKTTLICSLAVISVSGIAVAVFGKYLFSGNASSFIQNYLIRFASSDLLTGRAGVWAHYIDLMLHSWRTLFCAMPQSVYGGSFTLNGGLSLNRAHNIIIESVCAFGLIATLCILIWLVYLIIDSIRKHDGLLNLVPIGVLLSSGMMLHGHFDFHYYSLVAVAVAFLCYRSDRSYNTGRRIEGRIR